MTREEEIKQAAEKELKDCPYINTSLIGFDFFIKGAEWADAHNEGLNMHIKFLKEELIDKAVEWLHDELNKEEELHYIHVHGFDSERREQFLERFKQAMEGD